MGVGRARGELGEENSYKEQRDTSGPRQRDASYHDTGLIPGTGVRKEGVSSRKSSHLQNNSKTCSPRSVVASR